MTFSPDPHVPPAALNRPRARPALLDVALVAITALAALTALMAVAMATRWYALAFITVAAAAVTWRVARWNRGHSKLGVAVSAAAALAAFLIFGIVLLVGLVAVLL